MKNALPPGTNHRNAALRLDAKQKATAEAAIARQTAPRPPGQQATATVALPIHAVRSKTAKT